MKFIANLSLDHQNIHLYFPHPIIVIKVMCNWLKFNIYIFTGYYYVENGKSEKLEIWYLMQVICRWKTQYKIFGKNRLEGPKNGRKMAVFGALLPNDEALNLTNK
uniref:Uncharacterized protein n=1 Tax=Cacopsylla melanoneura TaxID=428564 RepID=A0A8D8R8F1_9HEMI